MKSETSHFPPGYYPFFSCFFSLTLFIVPSSSHDFFFFVYLPSGLAKKFPMVLHESVSPLSIVPFL